MRKLRKTLVSYSDMYRYWVMAEPNLFQAMNEFFEVSKRSADLVINSILCITISVEY
jgi:hypothetical protein